MKSSLVIGFIGFGEAASSIAEGLRESGVGQIFAYDINTHTPGRSEIILRRAGDTGVILVESSRDVAASCSVLLSTVTADQAETAALQTAPWLNRDHYYADLNSVSPASKRGIEDLIGGRGAAFVEAAIMAPVPGNGHRVPILLGGPHAEAFKNLLAPYGMRFDVISGEIGAAAATKMFRSIIVKGLESLIVECVLGAGRYGATERVLASLAETFPGIDWTQLTEYMIGRSMVHGERRAREMREVAATLRSIGIDPIMSEAAARRQDWCAHLGLSGRQDETASWRKLLEEIAKD